MRLSLWVLNSSLLLIFGMMLFLNIILQQKPPIFSVRPITKEFEKKKIPIAINISKIYKQDLFDTFTPEEKQILQKSLITPVPEFRPPKFVPPPPVQVQEFVDPLNISIKGIVFASNENKSVAMIIDETGKEKVYHLSDKIKDGQVVKIEKNKVIILRANGQQEIYLLRKDELMPPDEQTKNKWQYVIKKIDEQNFEIDPNEFIKKIPTMGNLIEELNLSTAYKDGEAIGIKVGIIEPNDIGSIIGLNKNDILLSINDLDLRNYKNRIKVYDNIMQMQLGDEIKLLLKRNDYEKKINYKLAEIEKPKKQFFIESAKEDDLKGVPSFKMSSEQQREAQLKKFEKQHQTPERQKVISDIRQRLLENMKKRSMDHRVRR
ncbi:hypothetical protein GF322_03500 [Candidatus Dependentiae bacterium]|nr:hypothetical protein [Candidatus Dependentiae bacterium]